MQSKKKDNVGITALYCRLSRDDGTDNDSNLLLIKRNCCKNTQRNTAFPTPAVMWMMDIREQTLTAPDFKNCLRILKWDM